NPGPVRCRPATARLASRAGWGHRSFDTAFRLLSMPDRHERTCEDVMIERLDDQQEQARDWFESLRDRLCAEFEAIERESGSEAVFERTPWERADPDGEPGGGGVRALMKGEVFEKVGVNVSTVGGRFSPDFAATVLGAEEDPHFFATGI